jgi:predicted amidohydrolase
LTARAIENQAYVVGVNRCGSDPSLTYSGDSIIIDPLGEIVAKAGAGELLLWAQIEIEKVREWRSKFPAVRDAFQENPILPT